MPSPASCPRPRRPGRRRPASPTPPARVRPRAAARAPRRRPRAVGGGITAGRCDRRVVDVEVDVEVHRVGDRRALEHAGLRPLRSRAPTRRTSRLSSGAKPGTFPARACQQRPTTMVRPCPSRKPEVSSSGVLESPWASSHSNPTHRPAPASPASTPSVVLQLPASSSGTSPALAAEVVPRRRHGRARWARRPIRTSTWPESYGASKSRTAGASRAVSGMAAISPSPGRPGRRRRPARAPAAAPGGVGVAGTGGRGRLASLFVGA